MPAALETAGPPPPRASSPWAWLATAAIAAAFAASRIAILPIPSDRAYDEAVYLVSARSVAAGHELFTQVFSSQPPAFLETLALALRMAGDRLETGRTLILAFSLVALFAIADIGRRAFGRFAAPAAAAALALSTTFGDLAHVVQAESPSMAISLTSLSVCLASRRRDWSASWLVLAGAVVATGCLFKLMVVPMAVPLALLLLLAPAGPDETDWRPDGRGLLLVRRAGTRAVAVAAGAAAVFTVPLLAYDLGSLYAQTVAFHLDKQAAYAATLGGNLARTASHLVVDGGIAAAAAAGAVLLLRQRRALALAWLLAWLLVMFAAIVQQRPLFWRHFILLCPPLALAASAAVELAAARATRSWRLALLVAAVAIWTGQALLEHGRSAAMYPLWPPRDRATGYLRALESAAAWIRDNTGPDEFVVSDDPLVVHLSGRQVPPALCDTSTARILARSLTTPIAVRESEPARVIVLRRGGRLSALGGYLEWVERHYEPLPAAATGLAESRTVWVRRREPPRGS